MQMKNNLKRIYSLVALLVAVCMAFCSCGYEPIESTEEESAVVGNIDSYAVKYEELRYITMICKKKIEDAYGAGIWENEETAELYREILENEVASAIKRDCAVIKLARGIGYGLSDSSVQEYVDSFLEDLVKELGGMSKYKKYLKENYMTDSFLRLTIGTDFLENAVRYAYIDLGVVSNDMNEIYEMIMDGDLFFHTAHIFISAEKDGRDDAESRALANEAYLALRNGESFESVMERYNEDGDMSAESGMYFLDGEVDERYAEVTEELRYGRYSEVISSGGGYVIIKRLEPDPQYVMLNISSLMDEYQFYEISCAVSECRDELVFTPNDLFNSIDLTKMQ